MVFMNSGVGTLVPSNDNRKNGTKVPAPEGEKNVGTEVSAPK